MPTADERLAALEAKVDAIADLRAVVLDMRADMNQRFLDMRAEMNQRFLDVRAEMNHGFAQTDQRFAQIDQRFAQIDAKVDRNFVWAMGMMVTGFISVIGALIGVAYR